MANSRMSSATLFVEVCKAPPTEIIGIFNEQICICEKEKEKKIEY